MPLAFGARLLLSDAYRLGSPVVHIPRETALVDAENEWTLRQVQRYQVDRWGCSVNPVRSYALTAIEHCTAIGPQPSVTGAIEYRERRVSVQLFGRRN